MWRKKTLRRIVKPSQPGLTQEIDKFYGRKFNITSFLFDKQLTFVQDPAPFKIAVCSRRAGKTIACAADLIHTAINNTGIMCLYITLSAANAKRILWKELKKIDTNAKLEGIFNEADLSVTFKNNSVIYLSGAKDKSEIEKFRGHAINLCYIDECQSFRSYIQDLIDDIIAPALLDTAGKLCLIGTPGPVPSGYFYDCSVSESWSKHNWTFWDNFKWPALSQGYTHQQLFDRELKRRGISSGEPGIQREYFGKWLLDLESLLIKYDKKVNHFDTIPVKLKYNYIMGIDVGFKDADAICVLAWSPDDPTTYLVEEVLTTKQGITELAEQIEILDKKYKVDKMIMDMGALGKKIGEEIIRRHKIPVEAADKSRKMENIELLNDALRRGHFKAKNTSRFVQDSYKVEIDWDKSTAERMVVSDSYHSDIIDSVLYAFKVSPAYSWEPAPLAPRYGTKEWADAQEESMFQKELEGLQNEDSFNKWLKGEDS